MASRFSALSPSGEPRGGLVIDGDLVGRSPFRPAEVAIRWGLPMLIVFAALAVWAERRVEASIEKTTTDLLDAAELDTSRLEITVDHRDVTIDGALPDETTAQDVVVLLEGSGEIPIRSATVDATESLPDSLGAISVTVSAADRQIVLTGNLPWQDHRDTLIEAAKIKHP